jgi:hypothetical protein
MQVRIHPQSLRTEDIRRMERKACTAVLDAYSQTKSIIGTAGAIDYSKNTGGRGALFSDAGKHLPLLDFVIDVENTLDETLSKAEIRYYMEDLLDFEKTTFSVEFMKVQERLGRQFMGRLLYPVKRYFANTHKPASATGVLNDTGQRRLGVKGAAA